MICKKKFSYKFSHIFTFFFVSTFQLFHTVCINDPSGVRPWFWLPDVTQITQLSVRDPLASKDMGLSSHRSWRSWDVEVFFPLPLKMSWFIINAIYINIFLNNSFILQKSCHQPHVLFSFNALALWVMTAVDPENRPFAGDQWPPVSGGFRWDSGT